MTTVAAIYARISQDRRRGTDDEGLTVDAQIALCRTWIERQGWTVGTIYRDDSISATTGDTRPGFERLLADKPERVVYRHQDRLVRKLEDTIRVLASGIIGHGTDGSTLDGTSASAEMVSYITAAVSQNEGRLKSERIKAAHLRDAQAGRYRGNSRPFGQERDGSWIEPEAQAIRQAVPDLLEGRTTFYAVAASWNKRGLLPPKIGKKGGTSWSGGKVSIFFQNPRLKGFQTYADETYPLKNWTPLLSVDEWDQMQSLIDSRRVGTHERKRYDLHLLTNVLTCGMETCGRGLTASSRGGYRIYRCPEGKGHVSVKAEPVEKWVRHMTVTLVAHREEMDDGTDSRELATARHKRHTLEAEHARWMEDAAVAGLQPSILATRQKTHDKDVSDLDARILELEAATGVDILRDHGAGWDDLSVSRQREIVSSLVSSIRLNRIGRGKRFQPEMVRFNFTPLGERYSDALWDSEAENYSPTRGRSIRTRDWTRPLRQDPWPGIDIDPATD